MKRDIIVRCPLCQIEYKFDNVEILPKKSFQFQCSIPMHRKGCGTEITLKWPPYNPEDVFNPGDKVRIVNYGHKMWITNEEADKMKFFPKHVIEKPKGMIIYDSCPEVIGKECVIDQFSISSGEYSVKWLNDEGFKVAWYKREQLERVVDDVEPF